MPFNPQELMRFADEMLNKVAFLPPQPPMQMGGAPPAPMGAMPTQMPPPTGAPMGAIPPPEAPGMEMGGGGLEQEAAQMLELLATNPEEAIEQMIEKMTAQGKSQEEIFSFIRDGLIPVLKQQNMNEQAGRIEAYLAEKEGGTAAGPAAGGEAEAGAPTAPEPKGGGEAGAAMAPERNAGFEDAAERLESVEIEVNGLKRVIRAQNTQLSILGDTLRTFVEMFRKFLGFSEGEGMSEEGEGMPEAAGELEKLLGGGAVPEEEMIPELGAEEELLLEGEEEGGEELERAGLEGGGGSPLDLLRELRADDNLQDFITKLRTL